MLINAFIFSFRKLRRSKLVTLINILSLTIGISACLVVFQIAKFEFSFDRFHSSKDYIYRIYSEFSGTFTGVNRGAPTAIYSNVKDKLSGIESITNFHTFPAVVKIPIKNGDEVSDFGDYKLIVFAMSDYFNLFNYYQWVVGSSESLDQPFKVVLTESRARTYFGNLRLSDIIGREIQYADSLSVTVSGIIKDIQERTDLNFTDFISFPTISKSWLKNRIQLDSWGSVNSSSQLFIKIFPGTPSSYIEEQLPSLGKVYLKKYNNKWSNSPRLQPLRELHFNPLLGIFDHSRSVAEKPILYIIIGLALLILMLGLINYVNIVTTQTPKYAKQIGIKKTLGSSKSKIVVEFLIETFVLVTISSFCALALVFLFSHYFQIFLPTGFKLNFYEPSVIICLLCFVAAVTLLGGLYPGLLLSSYHPTLALKGISYGKSVTHSYFLRRCLIVFQFSIAQILIFATITIGRQLNFMINTNLGLSSDAIIYFFTPRNKTEEKTLFLINELRNLPFVDIISRGSPPNYRNFLATLEFAKNNELLHHHVLHLHGDTSYLKIYNITLIAGRNYLPNDSLYEYLINETYLHKLGYTSPHDILGKTIDKKYIIVGVVKDFHTQPLHSNIEPLVIRYDKSNCIALKINTSRMRISDLNSQIKRIKLPWTKVFPDNNIDVLFLHETIKRLYENENRMRLLAKTSTVIALLISCLGLFGLASFTVLQRTKEIGIRKVMGGTVWDIWVLLSKDFFYLVIIAFAISMPVAYYIADWWLKGFAYRVDLTIGIYLLTASISVLIAILTISYVIINAAKTDPAKSLRYE